MRAVAIVPFCAGREDNLRAVLQSLQGQAIEGILLVGDGPDAYLEDAEAQFGAKQIMRPKHHPGMEQPRNAGVRYALELWPDIDYAWFVDSDVIVPGAFEAYRSAEPADVLLGPYEWLPPGARGPVYGLYNDPRWPLFIETDAKRWDLGRGLACFSGNACWNIEAFKRVGGFSSELSMGRVEDGELGIRAVEYGLSIRPVAGARGWHLWHPVDMNRVYAINSREVPIINALHPWVEKYGFFVAERDGKRFDRHCPRCQQLLNSMEIWEHEGHCLSNEGVGV